MSECRIAVGRGGLTQCRLTAFDANAPPAFALLRSTVLCACLRDLQAFGGFRRAVSTREGENAEDGRRWAMGNGQWAVEIAGGVRGSAGRDDPGRDDPAAVVRNSRRMAAKGFIVKRGDLELASVGRS